jgi:hypothetical protein
MLKMYPAQSNSPQTELSAGISSTETTLPVADTSKLPAAPNLVTIGNDETAETVLYTGISGNTLTGVTRGFDTSTPKAWAAGAKVARYFTAYDYEAFRQNINEQGEVLASGTDTAEPESIMKRNSDGRSQVATPIDPADIARKDTVEEVVAGHKAEADPHGQYMLSSTAEGNTFWRPRGEAPLDLNTATLPGTYFVNLSGAYINKPINMQNYCILQVDAAPLNTFIQKLTNVVDASYTWERSRQGGGLWTPWVSAKTMGNMVFYVHPDGNDNNNGLANTAAGAFKTISKAVSMIPQIVNHAVNVYVSPETYNENVRISGFSGKGHIYLNGAEGQVDTHLVTSISVLESTCPVNIRGFKGTITSTSPFYVRNCARVDLWYCKVDSAEENPTSAFWYDGSKGSIVNCYASNRDSGVYCYNLSQVNVDNLSGVNLHYRYASDYASLLTYYGTTPGNIGDFVGHGGIITNGNTGGVENPWGDNTHISRSRMQASNSAQSFDAGVEAKINFANKEFDRLGEYNPATSSFTVKKSGVYLFNVCLRCTSMPANTLHYLIAVINNYGGSNRFYQQLSSGSPSAVHAAGSVQIELSAGDYVDIRFFADKALTAEWGYLHVTRIA